MPLPQLLLLPSLISGSTETAAEETPRHNTDALTFYIDFCGFLSGGCLRGATAASARGAAQSRRLHAAHASRQRRVGKLITLHYHTCVSILVDYIVPISLRSICHLASPPYLNSIHTNPCRSFCLCYGRVVTK